MSRSVTMSGAGGLPPGLVDWINCASVAKYRRDYRQFRMGYARGAAGDVATSVAPSSGNASPSQSLEGLQLAFSTLNTTDNDEFAKPLKWVTEWRLAYHRFRRGKAEGAVGEIDHLSANLTADVLCYLPVYQLLQLNRRRPTSPQELSTVASPILSGPHLHFGAGRLGLGLILSRLEQKSHPFVIVQAASRPMWHQVLNAKSIDIKINKEKVVTLLVQEDGEDTTEFATKLEEMQMGVNPTRGLLLLTHRHGPTSCRELAISRAGSFSCSVGPGIEDLLVLLTMTTAREGSRLLFACENDHAAVERMRESLKPNFEVVPCMVDRICSDLASELDENRNVTSILVTTEPFLGEIVVMKDQMRNLEVFRSAVPFRGANVRVPDLSIQGTYFMERKLLLVNGGHTVLAFLTMIRAKGEGHTFSPPGELILLNWDTMTDKERAKMWAFSIARLLLVLWQYDVGILQDAHDVGNYADLVGELLEYTKTTLKRFSAVSDTTSRVLGGGVDVRYNGRLKNVQDFLDDAHPASSPVGKELLKQAGLRYCAMVSLVHQVTSEAFEFTAKGREEMAFAIPNLTNDIPSPSKQRFLRV